MKLHASVGADILSAIEFPYPVVPIVRHHHENWDGTGYPDGIKGTDIPIGARILSVVDCFDALTSDRPYRPRLSDADAIKILLERRGSMYDPLVVDTFIATYAEIAPPLTSESPERVSDMAQHFALEPRNFGGKGLDVISSSTEEMSVLFDLAQGISGCRTIADAADLVAKHLRRLIPASLSVIFLHDQVADELQVYHSVGEHADHFHGLKIQRGERLTGWVAANRQSILNSDPILDLGEVARGLQPRLRSCLSTPLLHDDVLVGVLSLYSVRPEAFSENHRRVAEIVARQIAPTIRHAMQSDATNRSHTRPLPMSARSVHDLALAAHSGHLSIAVIEVVAPRRSDFRERDIARIAETVKSGLRAADVLFRNEQDEFVALLGGTSSDAAIQVVRRIAERLKEQESGFERMAIVLGTASTPRDGVTIDSLIAAAKARREPLRRFADDDSSSIH
jgi:putative methionine-R-sulfoxide reductase with GAF domain